MKTIHITANSRLTALLKQQAVANSASEVIETPKVMTLAQWWQEWVDISLLNGELPEQELAEKVLSSFEAQWLFEQCLQEVLRSESSNQEPQQGYDLLNIPATAKQFYQAWQLSCEWMLDWQGDLYEQNLLEQALTSAETELYKQVLQRYLKRLENRNWQDDHLYKKACLNWLAQSAGSHLPNKFFLHGFDELTPNIEAWIKLLQEKGIEVESDQIHTADQFELAFNHLTHFTALDPYDEVQQVAKWALTKLAQFSQDKPLNQTRIAIVAPDLNVYKNALIESLDEQLYQSGLTDLSLGNHSSTGSLYNISLGDPLLGVPIIENAWQVLNLFLQPQRTITYQAWSEWLVSPYTLGNLNQRQQADANFRRLQWANLNWQKLLETDAAKTLPKPLQNSIQNWQQQFNDKSHFNVSLSEFMHQVWLLLSELSWPGTRTLSSTEYQQRLAFENALIQFSSLTDLAEKMHYSDWLMLLKRYLSEQVHQPQSVGHQPIQVMGMLEAGGQNFDALWVMGLTNEAWPRPSNPNPFLPIALQRDLAMPRSTAGRELSYAQKLSQRLVNSAQEVFWSYPKQIGEAVNLPSSIMPSTDHPQVGEWQRQAYQSLAQTIYRAAEGTERLEWQLDDRGTEVAQGAVAPGGTGILQAQSQCPLMAYIDYRLGAKYGLQEVEDSLQNTNQGTLIHAVLEMFWQELKTQSSLLTMTDEEKNQSLKKHIDSAFEELQTGLAEWIQHVEKSRILELCLEWLELETERNSFKVVETEKEHHLELAGIKFKIIIDRVDEVNGEAVIIDYKTGRASINDLMKAPLAAPQLAVYLLAVEQQVAGIGYGLLHSDDGVKLSAVVEDEEVLNKARTIKVFAKLTEKEGGEFYQVSWHEFLDHLKTQVLELAEQVQQGQAQMSFESLADIQYANGYLALRVPEVLQQLDAQLLQEEA